MSSYLFVTSRENYELAKKSQVIWFHDTVATLNNILLNVNDGDTVYFYITKEKIIAWRASICSKIFEGEHDLFSTSRWEKYVRRLRISFDPKERQVDFITLTKNLSFIKRKDVVFSAYLVTQFIKLNQEDAKRISDTFK